MSNHDLSNGNPLREFLIRSACFRGAQLTLLCGGLAVLDASASAVATAGAGALVSLSIATGGLSSLMCHGVIHHCAHPGSFSTPRADKRLGYVLCIEQLQSYRDYGLLHVFHHRFTNSPWDPNWVRPGESRARYVATLFFRQLAFMVRPEYRAEYRRRFSAARERTLGGATGISASVRSFLWSQSSLLPILALTAGAVFTSHAVAGTAGLGVLFAWWLAPVIVGYILLTGDFSYRSHLGLPARSDCHPYEGQDTRSLRDGGWDRFADWLTFGLHGDHRAHHQNPGLRVRRSHERGE